MELSEEQINKFSELECCYSQYFYGSVAPVMEQVRKEVNNKQLEEMKDYSNSFAGIISMAPNAMGRPSGNSMEMITRTGVWNRLKTEDYIVLCQERIGKSEQISTDLKLIADGWRNELVATIGRERYDSMSRALGADVSYAYAGYRMEQLMKDHLVHQNMPKSSLDYILKKAAENSLFGLPAQLQRSPLDREIAEAGEKAYDPSFLEEGTGKVLSFGMDTVTTCGFSSWASVGKLALFEVASEGAEAIYDSTREKDKIVNVEQAISQGVFGKDNALEIFRSQSKHIDPHENGYIRGINEKMGGRMRLIPVENLAWMKKIDWHPEYKTFLDKLMKNEFSDIASVVHPVANGCSHIPSVVLPGGEEAYLALQQDQKKEPAKPIDKTAAVAASNEAADKKELSDHNTLSDKTELIDGQEVVPIPEKALLSENKSSSTQTLPSGQSGWGGLLSSVGLSDVSSVGRNMGYVVSMLPDLLVGLFTGKTKSLKLMDNLFPLASILMGLFSRNPLVKMILVGLGGMNLMNKAGHESLEKKNPAGVRTEVPDRKEYKAYADEPLNPRVMNPEVSGDYLLATVDRVPCSIHLPEATVGAYQAGMLPLNTLANAVLAKSDDLRAMAQENYEASESRNVQARGIG